MAYLTVSDAREAKTTDLIEHLINKSLIDNNLMYIASHYKQEIEFNAIIAGAELNRRIPNGPL